VQLERVLCKEESRIAGIPHRANAGHPNVDPSSGGEVARVVLHEAGSTSMGEDPLDPSSHKGHITPGD
jgi:hypothetical protein